MMIPLLSDSEDFSLSGHFLLAMPSLSDPSFAGALVYLCEHSSKGAMGLVINRPTDLTVRALLRKIDLEVQEEPDAEAPVFFGGPVAGERGFVLHTGGGEWGSSLQVVDGIQLTTSRDILEALAQGHAPADCLIALGYAGWGEGQLEKELAENAWLVAPADLGVLFKLPVEERLPAAYRLLGVDPILMTHAVGHA
jgi:putative transcriptional regulator